MAIPVFLRIVPVFLAVVATLAGCMFDVATLQKRLEPHYRLQRPGGPGPFAAVLLVPGCGGITPSGLQTANDLVRRGYLVVFVDYLATRGLQTACDGDVGADAIARDIRAVSADLRSRPDVRPRAIAAVGWSLGGAGVLSTLVGVEMDRQLPLDAAVAVSPVCKGLRPWRINIPTLVLLAGRDDSAPPALCEDVILRGAGRVEIRMYPDAQLSFDMAGPSDAAREAWRDVLTHLQARLP